MKEAPQTVSAASPATQVAAHAEGAPAADLEAKIVAAFADGARSDDVGRLGACPDSVWTV